MRTLLCEQTAGEAYDAPLAFPWEVGFSRKLSFGEKPGNSYRTRMASAITTEPADVQRLTWTLFQPAGNE